MAYLGEGGIFSSLPPETTAGNSTDACIDGASTCNPSTCTPSTCTIPPCDTVICNPAPGPEPDPVPDPDPEPVPDPDPNPCIPWQPGCPIEPPPLPDLVPVNLSLNASDVHWGEDLIVRNRVHNQGLADADPSRTGYYLSIDADIDPTGDILLNTQQVEAVLADQTVPPYSTTPFQTVVTLPAKPPQGFQAATQVYIGVYVDDTAFVAESNENNNDAAIPVHIVQLPDLIPIEVSLNRYSREWGQRVKVRHRVTNQGEGVPILPAWATTCRSTRI